MAPFGPTGISSYLLRIGSDVILFIISTTHRRLFYLQFLEFPALERAQTTTRSQL